MVSWLKNAIFYEIYPQSFCDTNSDGIGDFEGIIQKLDYIKDLGCNAIWMNPCFDSPFCDAGYDVRDYLKTAERYGTNDDLKRLFDEVHNRDMHIILDLVPGHTSVEHKWFKESMKPERNEYSDRYIWTDSIWDSPDNLCALRGISDRDASCGVNFFSCQPALNFGYAVNDKPYKQPYTSPAATETRNAVKEIMAFWLDMGCDGFRVDMAGSLVKQDKEYACTIKVWQDITSFLKEKYPNAAMVSEWGEPTYSIQSGFDMDFLLHFGPQCYTSLFRSEKPFFSDKGDGDISIFLNEYTQFYKAADGKGLICIPSGNHDMPRLSRNRTDADLKVCFAFLLSMCGAPFIYYGDEIGMRYLEGITSKEGGYDRTGSRSPMQWNNKVNAGFSNASPDKLYIPTDDDKDRPNVEAQQADAASLLNEVKKLIKLRLAHEALQSEAAIDFIYAEKGKYPLVFERKTKDERILVVINPSASDETAVLPTQYSAEAIYSLNGKAVIDGDKLSISGRSAAFFKVG